MRKFWNYFIVAGLMISPSFAYADFDISTYMVELVTLAQKDGIGKINENAMSLLQEKSQNLVSDKAANFNVDELKSNAKDALKLAVDGWNLDDKVPSEFTSIINGVGSNPLMRDAAKKIFTVSKRSSDDVEKNKQLEEMTNDLMIENVSSMYARGLVRRFQLDNEKKEKIEDFNNVAGVQTVFTETIQRANNRWISMLQQDASLMAQTSMKQLAAVKPDEAEDEKDENKDGE